MSDVKSCTLSVFLFVCCWFFLFVYSVSNCDEHTVRNTWCGYCLNTQISAGAESRNKVSLFFLPPEGGTIFGGNERQVCVQLDRCRG